MEKTSHANVPPLLLPDQLRRMAATRPDAPAIHAGDVTLSYGALEAAAAGICALLLDSGVTRGDRICLLLPNSATFVASYYGVLKAGCAAVPLNHTHGGDVLASRLAHCTPRYLVLSPEIQRSVRTVATAAGVATLDVGLELPSDRTAELSSTGTPVSPEHTATVMYGVPDVDRPQGVELTHANLSLAAATAAELVLRLSPEDTVLSCFPLITALGQSCGLNAAMTAGAALWIPHRFDPDEILRVIAEHRVNALTGYPDLLTALPRAARKSGRTRSELSGVRTVLAGGGRPLPLRERAALEETFGCEVLECHGPSQSAGLACATPSGLDSRPGSVGPPVGRTRVRILGNGGQEARLGMAGELLLQGPHTMAGYLGDRAASDKAMRGGWLHTGDSARVDKDGWVYIVNGGWANRANERRSGTRRGVVTQLWNRLRGGPGGS